MLPKTRLLLLLLSFIWCERATTKSWGKEGSQSSLWSWRPNSSGEEIGRRLKVFGIRGKGGGGLLSLEVTWRKLHYMLQVLFKKKKRKSSDKVIDSLWQLIWIKRYTPYSFRNPEDQVKEDSLPFSMWGTLLVYQCQDSDYSALRASCTLID